MIKIKNGDELIRFACASQIEVERSLLDTTLKEVNDMLEVCAQVHEFTDLECEDFTWDMPVQQPLRPDEARTWKDRNLFMDQAPQREGDFFKAPRIMAEVE